MESALDCLIKQQFTCMERSVYEEAFERYEGFAGYDFHEIRKEFYPEYTDEQWERFAAWFILKGLKEGWITEEYGVGNQPN